MDPRPSLALSSAYPLTATHSTRPPLPTTLPLHHPPPTHTAAATSDITSTASSSLPCCANPAPPVDAQHPLTASTCWLSVATDGPARARGGTGNTQCARPPHTQQGLVDSHIKSPTSHANVDRTGALAEQGGCIAAQSLLAALDRSNYFLRLAPLLPPPPPYVRRRAPLSRAPRSLSSSHTVSRVVGRCSLRPHPQPAPSSRHNHSVAHPCASSLVVYPSRSLSSSPPAATHAQPPTPPASTPSPPTPRSPHPSPHLHSLPLRNPSTTTSASVRWRPAVCHRALLSHSTATQCF